MSEAHREMLGFRQHLRDYLTTVSDPQQAELAKRLFTSLMRAIERLDQRDARLARYRRGWAPPVALRSYSCRLPSYRDAPGERIVGNEEFVGAIGAFAAADGVLDVDLPDAAAAVEAADEGMVVVAEEEAALDAAKGGGETGVVGVGEGA